MDFTGKKVLVTGASRGIGLATARAFLECGASVAVNGRTFESVDKALAELGAERTVAAPGDLIDKAGCDAVVGAALDGLGGLDVLVNNAGVFASTPVESASESDWDRMIDINLKGPFFCIQAALPALRASRGNIVNTASESGMMGQPGNSIYCASKGGLINMSRVLALDLAPDVRINNVCPGGVDTDMMRAGTTSDADLDGARAYAPMKRIARPEEIADAILYLASDKAGFVTGATWQLDGGSTVGH
jgi:NAD(P)-dependent dehydrogenase (short-subunit alcohol dehydrogenase family)